MRVLVTGIAGFIASNLAPRLLSAGHDVVGLDNLSYGTKRNMRAFADHPSFDFQRGDIRDESAVRRVAEGCDAIIHLAAMKIPRYTDAYETMEVNVLGSHHVAVTARDSGARLIAASTSDVYGKNPEVPFREDSDLVMGPPTVKRWAYSISKMLEEQWLLALHERFGTEVVLMRFFNAYGPNQGLTWWGGPVPVMINKALDNEAIPIHGDGQQTRTFTYVDDIVEGIVAIFDRPGTGSGVVNLGRGGECTIEELARQVWRAVRGDVEPKLEYVRYETFGKYEDVRRRAPDVTKARTVYGFQARVPLEEGLRRTVEWQTERRREDGD